MAYAGDIIAGYHEGRTFQSGRLHVFKPYDFYVNGGIFLVNFGTADNVGMPQGLVNCSLLYYSTTQFTIMVPPLPANAVFSFSLSCDTNTKTFSFVTSPAVSLPDISCNAIKALLGESTNTCWGLLNSSKVNAGSLDVFGLWVYNPNDVALPNYVGHIHTGQAAPRRMSEFVGYCHTPPQPEAFYNVERNVSFTRNNCGAGGIGSSVNYHIAANAYRTIMSQEHADHLAQMEIDATGQAYANAIGTCYYPPVTNVDWMVGVIDGTTLNGWLFIGDDEDADTYDSHTINNTTLATGSFYLDYVCRISTQITADYDFCIIILDSNNDELHYSIGNSVFSVNDFYYEPSMGAITIHIVEY